MNTPVLLNLLNKMRKRDKMPGLQSILSLFRNKFNKFNTCCGKPCILSLFLNLFNKFNNTRARMLDSIYHMTLKLIKNRCFGVKTSTFCHLIHNVFTNFIA